MDELRVLDRDSSDGPVLVWLSGIPGIFIRLIDLIQRETNFTVIIIYVKTPSNCKKSSASDAESESCTPPPMDHESVLKWNRCCHFCIIVRLKS